MKKKSKIFIAGHKGLVGSSLVQSLTSRGFSNLLVRTRHELDLANRSSVAAFFERERPEYVFLAAAQVGGIVANDTLPADFIFENLAIQANVIHASHQFGVDRLLFLGSNCIYPKHARQPITESALLSGPLEPTNRPYALAKIAGIEMCWAHNRQHKTKFFAAMPINLYGPGDNYHSENSHVLPALLRRIHEAKVMGASEVVVWGSGTPKREFMFSTDMADACVHLMTTAEHHLLPLLAQDRNAGSGPLVNIGAGSDISISELAHVICDVVGFKGEVKFDTTKPDGTPRKLLDTTRMDELGWKPKISLREGLEWTYEAYLSGESRR